MEKTVLTVDEIAERWGIRAQTVRKMIQKGELPQAKRVPGVKVNIQEVLKAEETKDLNPLTAFERKRLEKDIENLKDENKKLRQILSNISVETSKFLGGNYEST